jgi:magnesium and cobalt transporter
MTDDSSFTASQPGLGSWLAKLFSGGDNPAESRDEILRFLSECHARGLLHADEFRMLQGVLKVSETHVRDIMIPRAHMVVLQKDDAAEDLLKTIVDSGHSRFPVIGSDKDEVVGTLLAKDVLRHYRDTDAGFRIDDLLRPALFVPESKRLNALLKEFRESHQHLAVVVDEYGSVQGIAALEDVLEEIVGDIRDEHDLPADDISVQSDGSLVMRASVDLRSLSARLGLPWDTDLEVSTIGGLITEALERIPVAGDVIDWRGHRIEVLRADRHRARVLSLRQKA